MSSETLINIDLKKEKKKEYDKDRVRPLYYKEKREEKTFCVCGCLVRRSNMYLHINTKKHEATLQKQSPENLLTIQQTIKKLDGELMMKSKKNKLKR